MVNPRPIGVAAWLPWCSVLTLAVPTSAQCAQWAAGPGVPGVISRPGLPSFVRAVAKWDPDGAGPIAPRLAIGGVFTLAGDVAANLVATLEPGTGRWQALGTGIGDSLDDGVLCFATLPNGELVVGGSFHRAGATTAHHVARWNGTSWAPLGTGTNDRVDCLCMLPNGDLVAGGRFTVAGGIAANYLARWDGTSWSALGAGCDSYVTALATLANGELVAGGEFSTAGGTAARALARWNGTSWSALAPDLTVSGWPFAPRVSALQTMANGDLIVGGVFTSAGAVPARHVARWNGTAWSALGTGVDNWVDSLGTLANGDLVVGGQFATAGGTPAPRIARWDGSSWSALGAGLGGASETTTALVTLPNGTLVAGGSFTTASGVDAYGIAQWNGTAWSALHAGTNGAVVASTRLPNGDLIVGGYFTTAGGVAAQHLARCNRQTWSPLGLGTDQRVHALATLPNGDVIAGGAFTTAGTNPAPHIARWDGTQWHALGTGTNGDVLCLAVMPNGDVVAGGTFTVAGGVPVDHLARWNGVTWAPVGGGVTGPIPAVLALAVLPNGDLAVGGRFAMAGNVFASDLAIWTGTQWRSLVGGMTAGNQPGYVAALLPLPGGGLIAGGSFAAAGSTLANHIARWDGTTWWPLGSGMSHGAFPASVNTLAALPNGEVVAGGSFHVAGGVSANHLARWNGWAWSALAAGTDEPVACSSLAADGVLEVGGYFTTADHAVSAYFARYYSTCPAMVASFGTGCVGSAGLNALSALDRPWVGSRLHTIATGMSQHSLALRAHGLSTTAVPLPALLPQGVPGCSLWVDPCLVDLWLPNGSSVETDCDIPNDLVLVGLVLHQQILPAHFDANGNLLTLTGTNALSLTIGAF